MCEENQKKNKQEGQKKDKKDKASSERQKEFNSEPGMGPGKKGCRTRLNLVLAGGCLQVLMYSTLLRSAAASALDLVEKPWEGFGSETLPAPWAPLTSERPGRPWRQRNATALADKRVPLLMDAEQRAVNSASSRTWEGASQFATWVTSDLVQWVGIGRHLFVHLLSVGILSCFEMVRDGVCWWDSFIYEPVGAWNWWFLLSLVAWLWNPDAVNRKSQFRSRKNKTETKCRKRKIRRHLQYMDRVNLVMRQNRQSARSFRFYWQKGLGLLVEEGCVAPDHPKEFLSMLMWAG
jgi:hypothetical protein